LEYLVVWLVDWGGWSVSQSVIWWDGWSLGWSVDWMVSQWYGWSVGEFANGNSLVSYQQIQ